MASLKYIQRKYKDGKLVAYMHKNSSVLRYKLCKIEKKWLTPTLQVKSNYPYRDADELNKEINELEERVDAAITALLYKNPSQYITAQTIDEKLSEPTIKEESNGLLLLDFKRFNVRKKEELIQKDIEKNIIRKTPPTFKDYNSACNAIEDYEYDNNCTLTFYDIDDDFLDKFKHFLAEKHVSTDEHKYKCKGGMVNKTINKRLECLTTFVRSFYRNETKAKQIWNSRIPQKVRNADIIRLQKDEVRELYNRNLKNSAYNRVRDYFVFLCLTGLRPSDFLSLNSNYFTTNKNGQCILTLYTQKVTIKIEIKLTKQAKEIAERYDYKFDGYTNQAFNRTLKEMLKDEELFEDEVIQFRNVLNQKPKPIKKLRREVICAYTGRRTFISNLIESGVPPIQVMSMTGHTKLSTLQIYIDKFSPSSKEVINVLEF